MAGYGRRSQLHHPVLIRVFSYGDYALDGDHHDVNCLRTLTYDYYPNGVQGRAL
jgi:hypothetical protein